MKFKISTGVLLKFLILTTICTPGCTWLESSFQNISTSVNFSRNNVKFMDIAPGDTEDDLKKTSWFNTCKLNDQNEKHKSIGLKGYNCKNPNSVTDAVAIALYKDQIRFILARFSEQSVNNVDSRSPSILVTDSLIGKFGKPSIETEITAVEPTDHVLNVCSMRGGCKVYGWGDKGSSTFLELYTSQVLISPTSSGWKDGAIEIKYFDTSKLQNEFEKASDQYDQNKNKETAKKIGI